MNDNKESINEIHQLIEELDNNDKADKAEEMDRITKEREKRKESKIPRSKTSFYQAYLKPLRSDKLKQTAHLPESKQKRTTPLSIAS